MPSAQPRIRELAGYVRRVADEASCSADHPLAGEFEDQMIALIREYKGDGEYLSVHHPATPGAKDDAPDATALALLAAAGGGIGEILFA